MRKTHYSASSPDRGRDGGEVKKGQMCCGIPSKEATTTAEKKNKQTKKKTERKLNKRPLVPN